MKQPYTLMGISIAALFILVMGCQKEEAGTGQLTVRMIDAPVDFDEVNIEIEQIMVHYSGGSGWVNLNTNAGVYNLLDLQNGVSATLVVDEELPAGHITQMRILLGDDNTVKVDEVLSPLELSSQDEAGLKLNLNTHIDVDDMVEVVFDFDAEKSIVVEGNGTFKLKPVLHLESVLFL